MRKRLSPSRRRRRVLHIKPHQKTAPNAPRTAEKSCPSAKTGPSGAPPADVERSSDETASRRKPPMLKPGDTVALISPAAPVPTERATPTDVVVSLQERLAQLGLNTVVGTHAFDVHGYLAGTDEDRAADVMAAFTDPKVQALLCINGGYGTSRLLDLLDYDIIARHPKVFIGYSDITALHTAIGQRSRIVTFLGPLGFEFARQYRLHAAADKFTWEWFRRAVMQPEPLGELPSKAPWQTASLQSIVPGIARGLLVGGNLSLLANTLGTPFEIDTTDKILLIEEVNEPLYRIDRMLTQLRLAGKLQTARGFIFAECINCGSADTSRSKLPLRQLFADIIEPLGKPSIYGLAAGHGPGRLTLPLGVETTVDGNNALVIIDESGVKADGRPIRP